jgi:signal transduction histidine kinase
MFISTQINNKTVRILVFSIYIILTILVCIILIFLGHKEIKKGELFVEKERKYVAKLLLCRKALNNGDQVYNFLVVDTTPKQINCFIKRSNEIRKAVLDFQDFKFIRPNVADQIIELRINSQLLLSLALAIKDDFNAHPSEQKILLKEDFRKLAKVLSNARTNVHFLYAKEIDNMEHWQHQSYYFYYRLQYILLAFFLLTLVGSVFASYIFSSFLKGSVRRLREGTRQISRGNLKYRFRRIQDDEVGDLMYDFNNMVERLQQQSDALTEMNENLKRSSEELIESHQHKDRFLANMSHELRTPLNSLIGFSELLVERSDTLSNEKVKRYGTRMLEAGEHLLDLITDLLEIAKVDAGVLKPVFSTFNLASSVTSVEHMLRHLIESKGLSFTVDMPDEILIYGDRRLINQVLINLLNNALKFTHDGGITLTVDVKDENCFISVTDTGIGITPENQKIIFKDFQRVEQGLTATYEGVGIGLTLSKKLIELHQGDIIVESELGKGSTFIVKIPRNKQEKE